MVYAKLPDEILTKLLKSDDIAAFNELYSRYWELLFNSAYRRIGSVDESKEIVQNIFMLIWEKRHSTSITNTEHYLKVAVKNRVINYFESRFCKNKYQKYITKTGIDQNAETEATIRYNELNQAFNRVIELLPEKTSSIFKMSRLDNLTVKEIAASLNVSEKVVEYHITSSLKFLRIHLKEFLTPGCIFFMILLK